MKSLTFVHASRYDLNELGPRVVSIRDHFDKYLDEYPVKSARSKHGLLGPVGKILQEAKGDRWDAISLAGYALNIHLANPRSRSYISQAARQALEDGTAELYALLRELPPAAQDKVLDRLDYGLYFVRRSKGMAYLQRIRDDFITYLRGRYGDGAKTANAWAEDLTKIGENFERVPYPSRGIFQKARGRKREDMSEFAKEAEMKGYDLREGEEDE